MRCRHVIHQAIDRQLAFGGHKTLETSASGMLCSGLEGRRQAERKHHAGGTVPEGGTLRTPPCVSHSGFRADGGGIGAREIRDPVRLPPAVVIGERLLPPRMIPIHLGPGDPDLDGVTAVLIVCIEFAVRAIEATHHG